MPNVIKAKRIRKKIAANMAKSWQTSPKCDFFMQINAEPMMEFRKKYNLINNVKISFLNIVMKAAATALKEFPYVNSSYDFENHLHLLHEEINVGIAIAVEDGLIVANVKNADKLTLIDVNGESERLIESARNGGLTVDDISGGTITINNMGAYKALKFHTAIINQPELVILSIYNIADEVVAEEDKIKIRKTMNIMLSADHRVVDGKMACEFLSRICELLENPEQLA